MSSIFDDQDIAHDIEIIRSWAERKAIVKRVWLYGSRVRGNHNPDSDLDVAIEHDTAPGDSNAFTTAICERKKWIDELQPTTIHELDIYSYRLDETPQLKEESKRGLSSSTKEMTLKIATSVRIL
jgi:predicted nucleotidyltransferase